LGPPSQESPELKADFDASSETGQSRCNGRTTTRSRRINRKKVIDLRRKPRNYRKFPSKIHSLFLPWKSALKVGLGLLCKRLDLDYTVKDGMVFIVHYSLRDLDALERYDDPFQCVAHGLVALLAGCVGVGAARLVVGRPVPQRKSAIEGEPSSQPSTSAG
jgi:hypothetical protein